MTTAEPSHSTPDDAASLMPEPGDAANLSESASSADDLIARLAEEQIDGLLDDAAPEPEGSAEIDDAVAAAGRTQDTGTNLVDAATRELQRELSQLKTEAPVPTPELIEPAPVIEVIEPEAIDSDAIVAPPSFNPPPHADVPGPAPTPPADEVVETTVARAPEKESDAEAVARELAADVAMLSTPLPAVAEQEAAAHAALPVDAWWKRVLAGIIAVPAMLLALINLPVRPLSDRGREIIGGVGVVTLVNAAGLLIYLAAFAHRH